MKREEILKEIKKYFAIHELVGKWTYKIHGERAWKFFDDDLLLCLLIIRKGLGKKITVNNWYWGGRFSQRGLRTILQQLVKNAFYQKRLYLSAHLFGKAVDFTVEGMTASEVRKWIYTNQHLFPCKIRLEYQKNGKEIIWVHLDTLWEQKNPKIYFFNV
ncbi:hypothetical protein [Tenacibaculum sp. 190524A02b]|uniref:hypothetical protein n=1 Tax=Tenacibaculum vairaonense TaxID=3137860 RepID=UPI0031FB8E3D